MSEPEYNANAVAYGTRQTVESLPLPPPTWWEWAIVAAAFLGGWALIGAAAVAIAWVLR